MDHTDKPTDGSFQDRGIDVVSEALSYTRKAGELRAAAVEQLLKQREQIDNDLRTLGYPGVALNGGGGTRKPKDAVNVAVGQAPSKRFKDLALAEVCKVLLKEHGTLHGSDIEKLAKLGGLQGNNGKFQNYLPVALKRAGGFENIGGNRWTLNEAVPPKR